VTASSTSDSRIDPAEPRPGTRRETLAVALGLFVTALLVRLIPWRSVFQPDGVVPYGGDAYYHMFRIRDTVERFPAILQFDPMMNFPDGAEPIWPPTFDWIVAALLRIGVGPDAPQTLEHWIMWVAPLLGAATVVGVYFLGRHFFSPKIGGFAALLLAILPAHFNYSQLGFADHHVAVSLVAMGLLWLAMQLFAEPAADSAESSDVRGLKAAIWLGLAAGGLLLIWPGALIHIAILQVALVVRLLATRDAASAICWAKRFALLHGVMFVVVSPLALGHDWLRWGRFSPVVLSNFQPIYLGAAALAFLLCAWFWPRLPIAAQPIGRAAVAGALGVAMASMLFGLIPELQLGAVDSWTWLSRGEEFQAAVGESVPLFRRGAEFDWQLPGVLFGASIFFVPIALVALATSVAGRGDRAFFLWWTAAFFLATLYQRRFMDTYAIPHALLVAWFALDCFERTSLRFAGRRSARRGLAIAMIVAVLALMWPIHERYERDLRDLVLAARGEDPPLRGLAGRIRLIRDAAIWLRDYSPEPTGPGYSILGPWDTGHLIQYVAGRPVVQNNFGDDIAQENFDRAERYFSAVDENEAIEILAPARVRYVLARSTGSGHAIFGYTPTSMTSRLFAARGSRGQIDGIDGIPPTQVQALERHRLVFESSALATTGSQGVSATFVKLFEIVPGAEILGRAPAGVLVRFRLKLQSRNGGGFVYEAASVADDAGRYRVRLPYSNETFSPDIRMAPSWHAIVGDETIPFRVSEAAVEQRLEIEGPEFE
jgi:dolichyl-diphosphooligosaccharide--protein glycosyltransferase